MCGIAGMLLAPGVDPARLRAIGAMTDVLWHRGPDGRGLWTDREAGVALGQRRLAIIDLSEAGLQPMHGAAGRLVVSYNGEIYNAEALRPRLAAAGYRFRGHSDTEVMLAAFEQDGIAATLPTLAGMFATAVWDREARALTLIRDPVGKKPLYIARTAYGLVFGSELRALQACPGFSPRLDHRALSFFLKNGWIPEPLCIWEGVFKLPPGTMLTVTADDLVRCDAKALLERARPWWSLDEVIAAGRARPFAGDEEAAEEELDKLLRQAVRERMVADVPLGAFLSGGIDSSTVVALMQAQSARPVRSFTIAMTGEGYNEGAHAARIARHLGTSHTTLEVTAQDALDVIPNLPDLWDEPFADESQIPTYLVAKLARADVTVALSGDGGDESFGGYRRHVEAARIAWLLRLPPAWRRSAAAAAGLLGGRCAEMGRLVAAPDGAALHEMLVSVCDDRSRPDSPLIAPSALPPIADPAEALMARDTLSYLPGDVLTKVDRASMAVALEARCPLLDHRVIAFAWSLPMTMKIRNGTGKWLLRRVLARYVPQAMFDRPKAGFNVPISEWLAGPLRAWVEAMLDSACHEGLLDRTRLRGCWAAHVTGQRDHGRELWAALTFEAWRLAQAARGPVRITPAHAATEDA